MNNVVQLFRENPIAASRQASDSRRFKGPNERWKRSGFCLAPHGNIRVSVSGYGNWGVSVTHEGTLDELLACDMVVTPKVAAQLKTKQKGRTLYDEHGARLRTLRKPSKACPERICVERWSIRRGEQALRLPGVRQLFPDGLFLEGDVVSPDKPASVSVFRRNPDSSQDSHGPRVTGASADAMDPKQFISLLNQLDEIRKARVIGFIEGLLAARPKQ